MQITATQKIAGNPDPNNAVKMQQKVLSDFYYHLSYT